MKNQDLRDNLAGLERGAPVFCMGREVVKVEQKDIGKAAKIILTLYVEEKEGVKK